MTVRGGVDSSDALEAALKMLEEPSPAPAAAREEPAGRSSAHSVPCKRPTIAVAQRRFDAEHGVRDTVLASKAGCRRLRKQLREDTRRLSKSDPERHVLAKQVEAVIQEEERLERILQDEFVPLHGPGQLVLTQQLAMSELFNVRSKAAPRNDEHEFGVQASQHGAYSYSGPELRQSDGLVFMALINMIRDLRVGTLVAFDPAEMCHWLYGRYDGPQRVRLKEAIYRLQQALLKFADFSVQLAMRFNYPPRGNWSVMLDPEVVKLFKLSPLVWIDIETRRSLPDGLTSWLYCYVQGQQKLIPQRLDLLKAMCGSEAAEPRSFETTLSRSMKHLVDAHIVETWKIRRGVLHWCKSPAARATVACERG